MRHALVPRLWLHDRSRRRRHALSGQHWSFRRAGGAHGFLKWWVRHTWRTNDDCRRFYRVPGSLMRHVPMHRLLLHCGSLFLSGDGFANFCDHLLRHAFKSAHRGRALDVFFDFGMHHSGTGRYGWQLNHGHGCGIVPAPMMLLLRRHLVSVHRLYLPLGHGLTAGLLHLGAGWSSLVDKRMLPAVAGHDLRHVHAVLVNRGLPHDRRIDIDIAPAHELVGVDKGVAGRAEAVAGITVAINSTAHSLLRRQRGPAHAIAALTPRHPGRSPLASRHPDPAVTRQIHPAAIVIGGPSKGLV